MDSISLLDSIILCVETFYMVAGLLSYTVYHVRDFTVKPGDFSIFAKSMSRVLEFMWGSFRFVAWATKGTKTGRCLSVGMYGPHGAKALLLMLVASFAICLTVAPAFAGVVTKPLKPSIVWFEADTLVERGVIDSMDTYESLPDEFRIVVRKGGTKRKLFLPNRHITKFVPGDTVTVLKKHGYQEVPVSDDGTLRRLIPHEDFLVEVRKKKR